MDLSKKIFISLACIISTVSFWPPRVGFAQASKVFDETYLRLGVSTWVSSGDTTWNHDASSSSTIMGNPTSRLTYEDQDINIYEFNAVLMIQSYYIKGDFGFGAIDDGRLQDDDFLRGTSGDFLTSSTSSNLDGDGIFYFNLDIGYALLGNPTFQNSYLRGFIGYQHWSEKSEAKGIRFDTCTVEGLLLGFCLPAGSISNEGELVLTNKVTWNSFKVGLDGKLAITDSLIVESSFAFIPYATMENEDNHVLRTDLAQPSFVMDGSGYGYNLDIKASYEIIPKTFLSAGYRYWEINSDGDIDIHAADGSSSTFFLNDLDSKRSGFTLGLTYRF